MMTLDELVARCKASVMLTINGHRDVYGTVEQYISETDEVTSEVMARFHEGADVFELQFYPSTPIGFYRVWGTSLADVLDLAAEALGAEGQA